MNINKETLFSFCFPVHTQVIISTAHSTEGVKGVRDEQRHMKGIKDDK